MSRLASPSSEEGEGDEEVDEDEEELLAPVDRGEEVGGGDNVGRGANGLSSRRVGVSVGWVSSGDELRFLSSGLSRSTLGTLELREGSVDDVTLVLDEVLQAARASDHRPSDGVVTLRGLSTMGGRDISVGIHGRGRAAGVGNNSSEIGGSRFYRRLGHEMWKLYFLGPRTMGWLSRASGELTSLCFERFLFRSGWGTTSAGGWNDVG
jgi:hypothetical protein